MDAPAGETALRPVLVVDRGEDVGVRPQVADLEKHAVGSAQAHEEIVNKGDPALRSITPSWRLHRASLRRALQERGSWRPLERELRDRLGQLLGRVRHRRMAHAADVAELRAGDQPLEAAALARSRTTSSVPQRISTGTSIVVQPARLGVHDVRQGGFEAGQLLANSSVSSASSSGSFFHAREYDGPGGQHAPHRAPAQESPAAGRFAPIQRSSGGWPRPMRPPGRAGAPPARSP